MGSVAPKVMSTAWELLVHDHKTLKCINKASLQVALETFTGLQAYSEERPDRKLVRVHR